MAYANTSYTAFHAVKSFHNKTKSVSNKRLENKCNKCGRSHGVGKCLAKDKTCLICQITGHFAKCCHKNRRQSYHQPSSLSGTNKTSTQPSNHKLRPVVKVHMVNEQGDYKRNAHWEVVENSIGPNYTGSVDLVYNPHYKHPTSPTSDPPSTTEQIQEVHGIEERCKESTYTIISMIKMEGKKVFHNTGQKVKVKLDGGTSENLMPSSV